MTGILGITQVEIDVVEVDDDVEVDDEVAVGDNDLDIDTDTFISLLEDVSLQ